MANKDVIQPVSFLPNATAASLLGFLHEGPMTGWDLVQIAQERIGNFWSLTRSQVYNELDKLAKHGLVEAGERGQRDSRKFTISLTGRQAFKQWLSQSSQRQHIRFPMLLTVSFARFVEPDTLLPILKNFQTMHQKQLKEYLNLRNKMGTQPQSKDGQMTLSYGIAYEKMTLVWISDVLAKVAAR